MPEPLSASRRGRAGRDLACSHQADMVAPEAADLTGPAFLCCGTTRDSCSFPPGGLSVPYHRLQHEDQKTPKAQHSLLRDQTGDEGQQLRAMGTWVRTTLDDTDRG